MNPSDALSKNRRSSKRRTSKDRVLVICAKGAWGLGANLAVSVLDVSAAGICLVVKSSLSRGQELTLTMCALAGTPPVRVLARVMWCVKMADGNYCVGASFKHRLVCAELAALATS